jgi:hypothetical protein
MIVHHLDVYSEKKRKLTANQFAKLMILEKGENYEYWSEYESEAYELMTDKEREDVQKALRKQYWRVREFLGINKIEQR